MSTVTVHFYGKGGREAGQLIVSGVLCCEGFPRVYLARDGADVYVWPEQAAYLLEVGSLRSHRILRWEGPEWAR